MCSEWTKKCPECGKNQTYTTKKGMKRARRNNTLCKSCSNKGKRNPNYGKSKKERTLCYFKYCPECKNIQRYSSKYTLREALKKETLCYSCSNIGERNGAYKENKEYKRECPGCGKTLEYKYSSGLCKARNQNAHCSSCGGKGLGKREDLYRDCPECGKTLYYSSEQTLKNAKKRSAICRKCKSKGQPSPMEYLDFEFSDEHREKIAKASTERQLGVSWEERFGEKRAAEVKKRMIEGLTGMSYDKYISNLDEKQKYERKARILTYANDLSKLKNYGKEGYEVDHIYPVSQGYYNNVSLEAISSLENLQVIPIEENRKKGSNIPDSIPDHIRKELKI